MSDKELNKMIDWCRKKISNIPHNYSGKRKEGYEDAMLQVMSYLYSKKDSVTVRRAVLNNESSKKVL